jgi:hypothetical protein
MKVLGSYLYLVPPASFQIPSISSVFNYSTILCYINLILIGCGKTNHNKYKCYIEEFCVLGYNAVSSVESRPMFRRNMSLPSSGSENKQTKRPARSRQQTEAIES